jgi:hypothetical protein
MGNDHKHGANCDHSKEAKGMFAKGGWFEHVGTRGDWFQAAQDHLNPTEGRKGIAYARIGGVGVGAAIALRGLLVDRNGDDEDLSTAWRVTQVGIGIGVAALAALMGGRITPAK